MKRTQIRKMHNKFSEVVIVFVLLLIVLWMYFITNTITQDQEIVDRLIHDLKKILEPIQPNIVFSLVSDSKTYTSNKRVIHILIVDPKTSKTYNYNTLLYVAIHELTHVMCPEEGHTDLYYKYNKLLVDQAIKDGFLISGGEYDNSYPCHED